MDGESSTKRGKRSIEDRIAKIDEEIAKLQAKKEQMLWPKLKQEIFEMVPSDMSPQEFADRLGISWGKTAEPSMSEMDAPKDFEA